MIPQDQMSDEDPWYAFPCMGVRRVFLPWSATYRNDLWRGIVGTPTACLEHPLSRFPCRHPKVRNLDILILVQ